MAFQINIMYEGIVFLCSLHLSGTSMKGQVVISVAISYEYKTPKYTQEEALVDFMNTIDNFTVHIFNKVTSFCIVHDQVEAV